METMTVIKNGKQEEREVDYIDKVRIHDDLYQCGLKYPVMRSDEFCEYTLNGECYVFDGKL